MDETMKIYEPRTLVVDELKRFDEELKARTAKEAKTPSHIKESKWKFFFDWNVWKDVFHENAEREQALDKKHPWVEILHRWITLLCVALLCVALIFWAINAYAEHTAEEYGTLLLQFFFAAFPSRVLHSGDKPVRNNWISAPGPDPGRAHARQHSVRLKRAFPVFAGKARIRNDASGISPS